MASVHLRGRLKVVRSAVRFWKRRLAELGFRGPIWATEHGYPNRSAVSVGSPLPRRAGPGALPQPVGSGTDRRGHRPRLRDPARQPAAGRGRPKGLIGGTVFDPPSPDPQVQRKPVAVRGASLRAVTARARPERRAPDDTVDRAVAVEEHARRAFLLRARRRDAPARHSDTSPASGSGSPLWRQDGGLCGGSPRWSPRDRRPRWNVRGPTTGRLRCPRSPTGERR